MSFQSINSNYNKQYLYPNNMSCNAAGNAHALNPTGPYLYQSNPINNPINNLNNLAYTYNPDYTPNIPQSYKSLGQIQSTNGDTTHLYKLNNGHTVAIVPVKNKASIIKTFINAGSLNETDEKRGVMHIDEHGIFKGSKKLKDGDVFRLTGLMGASTNASTDYAKVDCYITAPFMSKENLNQSIEIQGDMIYNPLLDKDAMESEKGPVCSEISMINDNPYTNAFDKCIRNLFQIKSNSHNLVAGSIETVQNLSRDDMVQYHQTYYAPQNMYTVVMAEGNPDEIINEVAKNFKSDAPRINTITPKKQELSPVQHPVRQDIITTKSNSSDFIISFAGPKASDSKDFIVNSMLNYYLSTFSTSTLKKDLEDLDSGYAYEVQKVGLDENDPEALVSIISTTPKNEQKALDAFYDAILKLQNEPLGDDDLMGLKRCFAKNMELIFSDSEVMCDILGGALSANCIDYYTNYKDYLASVTKEDIMNFARKYYDLNKVSIVALHPSNVTQEEIQNNYNNSRYSFANSCNNNNLKAPLSDRIAFQGLNNKNMIEPLKNNCAGSISFKSNATANIDIEDEKELTLQNNTEFVMNNIESNLCIFKWSIVTKPIKPKNSAIPSVLSYMFSKGTNYKNQKELERFKELNGIDAEIDVSEKGITVEADCLVENTATTLELLKELVYEPKLTQADLDEAKRSIKSALMVSDKDASSNLLDNLYPGFFPTDKTILADIDKLTLEDVKEFYMQLLQNASSSVVATMPFKQRPELKDIFLLSQSTGGVTFKKPATKLQPIFYPQKEPVVLIDTDDLNQAQILKTYKFPMAGNVKDEATFELINAILGASPNSRLFQDLREQQNLAYSVSSSINSFENTNILSLKIQTTTDHKDQNVQSFDNVQKSLDGFKNHTDKLQNELVTDEELLAAKTKLKQKVTGQKQNPISETRLLAMNMLEPYGVKRIDEYIKVIDSITKEDVKRVSNFIFSHNPTISILASPDTIENQKEYLKTQGKVVEI